jgi:hypothetical protein
VAGRGRADGLFPRVRPVAGPPPAAARRRPAA